MPRIPGSDGRGAGYTVAHVRRCLLTTTAGGTAMVGAQAKGDAGVSIGPDGLDASAGGEAFVGGKADANHRSTWAVSKGAARPA